MNKRVRRVLEPGSRLFFIILILFAVVTAVLRQYVAAACEFGVIALVYIIYARSVLHRRKDVVRYIDQVAANLDSATKDSVVNFPLPMLIVRLETGEILWCNPRFTEVTGMREHLFETKLSDLAPDLDTRWMLEGKADAPGEYKINERIYTVSGNVVRSSGEKSGHGFMGTLYFHDVTDMNHLRREAVLSKPAVSIIMIDNYDEITKNISDSQKSAMLAAIDQKVAAWAAPAGGILRKFDRDRFLFLFEERHLIGYKEKRFNVLESMREITGAGGIPVTLSIGIGLEGENMNEEFGFAQLAIEMALSRGGDQVVIKHRYNFEFYGGHSKEVEKRTKVKSRIMASTLAGLMKTSSRVMTMGHAAADIDSIGAAAGIVCIARKCGIPAQIVVEEHRSPAGMLIDHLRSAPEYAGVFIDSQTAMLHADASTLLVVVDCNRPEIVESPALLQAINRVAVIDHHRRAATYIDKADLNFHEPYASSAAELVTELLHYICESGDVLRTEAAALLGGIVLDTKNFTLHTGVSTFEAAAFLRGAGADTVLVKKLFQSDLASATGRYEIIKNARMVGRSAVISVIDNEVDRTIAAQAADELLNVTGITASFVVFPIAEQIMVSARSLGEVNVQIICEKLGGGGHQLMAGAQIKGATLGEVTARLEQVIEEYYAE